MALHAGQRARAGAADCRGRDRLALLALATAPPALAGPAARGADRAAAVGAGARWRPGWSAGSVALVAADRRPQARAAAEAGVADALWLGLAQAAALAPGVSRSGAVRAAARARGFTRAAAAELAAETALPVLAGATALKGVRLARGGRPRATLAALGAGAAAAALSTAAARSLARRRGAAGRRVGGVPDGARRPPCLRPRVRHNGRR